jgi:hypothetical protein
LNKFIKEHWDITEYAIPDGCFDEELLRIIALLKKNLKWMGDWWALDVASRNKGGKFGGWSGNCMYTYSREISNGRPSL